MRQKQTKNKQTKRVCPTSWMNPVHLWPGGRWWSSVQESGTPPQPDGWWRHCWWSSRWRETRLRWSQRKALWLVEGLWCHHPHRTPGCVGQPYAHCMSWWTTICNIVIVILSMQYRISDLRKDLYGQKITIINKILLPGSHRWTEHTQQKVWPYFPRKLPFLYSA